MKSQLYIPKKIKVGYQHRQDTYTKKLAYVIYYDGKGVLRKEKSWRSWIHDKPTDQHQWDGGKYTIVKQPGITPDDFDNVPTEGFVLNKKAGGYSTGWNHRQTYCRVWDPRGFEFEISIPNLLFILQETSSFKGKGLDGEFVYAWDGTELVLLPTSCEDYKKCEEFTELQTEKISTKDLVAGCVYMTKKQEKLVYMGKFPWTERTYKKVTRGNGRIYDGYKYVTQTINKHIFQTESGNFNSMASISNVVKKVTDICVTDYAERMDKLQKAKGMSKVVGLSSEKKTLILPPANSPNIFNVNNIFLLKDGVYTECNVQVYNSYDYRTSPPTFTREDYYLWKGNTISIEDGALQEEYQYSGGRSTYTRNQIEAMDFRELYVELENGKKVNYKNYQ